MKNYQLLAAASIMLTLSCKKDKFDKINRTASITFGDETNMLVNKYDYSLTSELNHPATDYYLDVDHDGETDIEFTVNLSSAPQMVIYHECLISWLTQFIQLYGYEKNDTTFLTTTGSSHIDPAGNHVTDSTRTTSCEKSPMATVFSVAPNQFKLLYSEKNMTLNPQSFFKVANATLVKPDQAFEYPITPSPGIIIDLKTYSYNFCDNMEQGKEKYIGFKLNSNNEVRLGWIKVLLIDPDKILIMESAIQR